MADVERLHSFRYRVNDLRSGGPSRIVVVRHDEPNDDRLTAWATSCGIEAVVVRPYRGEKITSHRDDIIGTVVCGGDFNAYDTTKHPFLREEYQWIDHCLDQDIPLLGICQGAQQLAWHLGAHVGATPDGRCEFGVHKVEPTDSGRALFGESRSLIQAHWHTFELPDGAVRLASSDNFDNQAFKYRAAYAFQFHAEVTIQTFQRWQVAKAHLYTRPGAQPLEQQNRLLAAHEPATEAWFFSAMDTIFS